MLGRKRWHTSDINSCYIKDDGNGIFYKVGSSVWEKYFEKSGKQHKLVFLPPCFHGILYKLLCEHLSHHTIL